MKKVIAFLFIGLIVLTQTACNRSNEPSTSIPTPAIAESSEFIESASETAQKEEINVSDINNTLQISVQSGDNTVVFELNNSKAARELYAQLPTTITVENYSNNEKFFHLEENFDIIDSLIAAPKIGTLAYYEPWGNVVIFYGEASPASGLYELGEVISGVEYIESMTGTIQIDVVKVDD